MADLVCITLFLLLTWGLGQGVVRLLKQPGLSLLALPLGLSLLALLGNALYFAANLPLPVIQLIFIALGVAGWAWALKYGLPGRAWRELGVVYLIFLFLALPAWLGGQQYYIFRSSFADHFNYIDLALTLYDHEFNFYRNFTREIAAAQPVYLQGKFSITYRPVTALLFSSTFTPGWGDVHLRAFLFTIVGGAMVYPAAFWAWERMRGTQTQEPAHRWFVWLPPLALTIGFWGQLMANLNAWSNILSCPIFLALTFFYAGFISRTWRIWSKN